MTVQKTDASATDSTVHTTGEATKITRESYGKRFNADGTTQSTERYRGTSEKIEEYYAEVKALANVGEADLEISKGVGTISVVYSSDSGVDGGDEDTPGGTTPKWTLDIVEVMRPLATHPYWQLAYFPGAGVDIDFYLTQVDVAIARGEDYTPTGDAYDDYVQRYYGLRAAGVEQYPALGLQLSKEYITSAEGDISAAYTDIGKVVAPAAIEGLPSPLTAAMDAVEQISSFNTSDPASVQYTAGGWEWLKRPTRLNMGGNADATNIQLIETWWGLDKWSAVLYKDGSWDPPNRA